MSDRVSWQADRAAELKTLSITRGNLTFNAWTTISKTFQQLAFSTRLAISIAFQQLTLSTHLARAITWRLLAFETFTTTLEKAVSGSFTMTTKEKRITIHHTLLVVTYINFSKVLIYGVLLFTSWTCVIHFEMKYLIKILI